MKDHILSIRSSQLSVSESSLGELISLWRPVCDVITAISLGTDIDFLVLS